MNNSNYEQPQPNQLRSQAAKSLLLRLFTDLGGLANQEFQLVKTEITQKRGPLVRAVNSLVFAIAFGLVALVCVSLALIGWLSVYVGLPLAALILGLVYAVIAAVTGNMFQKSLTTDGGLGLSHTGGQLLPKSKATTKTIGEQEADIAWTRRRIEETLTALEHKSDLAQPLRDSALGMGALGVAVANIVRVDGKTRA
jgi:Putative Actinobacterial Holin-X, holin superfamily III